MELAFDQYRLKPTNQSIYPPRNQPSRVRHTKPPFIRGPIPLNWIQRAIALKGAALPVGMILWYFSGLKRSQKFKIGINDIAKHINRSWGTTQRGLLSLEKEKLINIERHNGCKHIVTILEFQKEAQGP